MKPSQTTGKEQVTNLIAEYLNRRIPLLKDRSRHPQLRNERAGPASGHSSLPDGAPFVTCCTIESSPMVQFEETEDFQNVHLHVIPCTQCAAREYGMSKQVPEPAQSRLSPASISPNQSFDLQEMGLWAGSAPCETGFQSPAASMLMRYSFVSSHLHYLGMGEEDRLKHVDGLNSRSCPALRSEARASSMAASSTVPSTKSGDTRQPVRRATTPADRYGS